MERLATTGSLSSISVQHRQKIIRPKFPKFQLLWRKRLSWGGLVSVASLNAEISSNGDLTGGKDECISDEMVDDPDSQILNAEELNALLMNAERKRLVKKLSEANQYNRFLKRQIQSKDDDLINLKSDLTDLELELQALVGLAEEVANLEVSHGTRKINGAYIQSHLVSRLEAVHGKLQQEVEGVDLIKSQEVTLFWVGMAQSVAVMGSFDGWSQGEEMSPEYDGGYNKFSVTLKLRSGRYEIKFLVDGQWLLSPELPTVGEGLVENNLLIV